MSDIYAPDFIAKIKSNLVIESITHIIEVGSLNGDDAKFYKLNFPNTEVFAIEGSPDNFNRYLKNEKEIKTFNHIICNFNGNIDFYIKDQNGINGIFDRGSKYNGLKITRPCITLDKFCEDNNISKIDALKIDVEGATLNVLLGMSNMLSKTKIMHIETETHSFFKGQSLHTEVVNFLEKNNFNMLQLSKVEILKDQYQCDSIWLNKL